MSQLREVYDALVDGRTLCEEVTYSSGLDPDTASAHDERVARVEAILYRCALDPDKPTDRAFFLKAQLRQHQLDEVRREARAARIAQLESEIARLPEEARRIAMAAMARAFTTSSPHNPASPTAG